MRALVSPVIAGCVAVSGAAGAAVLDSRTMEIAAAGPSALRPASAFGGTAGVASVGPQLRRTTVVSRAGETRGKANPGKGLQSEAEKQAEARGEALAELVSDMQQHTAELEQDLWVLPLAGVSVTAEFGAWGLWSGYHTGIDFNGSTGDAILAVARGVVTSAAYDGAYGNKTVVTLEDGTEIWYCHQNAFAVSVGDTVSAGEVIGYVGSTGNVTGSHLHLEVRPGGGDPVDPRTAFEVQGLL